jgi:hypothetical protein
VSGFIGWRALTGVPGARLPLLLNCSPAQFRAGNLLMAFLFEKLEVYQKAVDFADQIAAMTEGFPRGYGFLVDQLNRAARG